ncbi:MAG: SulP family inorganic anion transporter [Puniceicoccaceae bacterium]
MKRENHRTTFHPRSLELLQPSLRPSFTISGEIGAGITVGLIALPLALALGIASVPSGAETPLPPPAIGIFTAIIGGFIISLFGGSRVQIGGPTAAFIPIILLIIKQHGFGGLILATMMAGMILIFMGLARMGALIKYIPWPVTSGFTSGIAVAIIITQLPSFAGLQATGPVPNEFFEKIPWLFKNFGSTNPYELGLALSCLAFILLWPRLRIKAFPGSVVAIITATIFVYFLHWQESHNVATIGSRFGTGAIPSQFPAFALPQLDFALVRELIGPAIAIALLGAIESLLSAVVADGLSGDRHDSNTELIAQGLGNLICPLFGGLPITGAIARTSANVSSGGKSPLAGIIHAATLLTIVLLAAPLALYIPTAAMAAVLVVVALRMGEWIEFKHLAKIPRSDALVFLSTFLLTVVFDLVIAVEVGMVLAAILYIKRVSETTEVSLVTENDMLERPEHIAQGKPVPNGVLVYRIFGPFLFGAAEKMEKALASHSPWPKILILRLHLVTAIDLTGMHALHSVVERMKHHHGTVILSGIHQQPLQILRKAGFLDEIGRENFCATFDDSLARAKELLKE